MKTKTLYRTVGEKEMLLIIESNFKKFPPSAITEMYFGTKTSEIVKESFYELFKELDMKFYEVFPSNFKLDFKLINETKRKLKYNLAKFHFEILLYKINVSHESYYIFYKGSRKESEIKEFVLAFREKFCIKENSLYIFDNKEIANLIDVYPKNDDQYIKYADSIITVSDDWEESIINNPFKDFKYNEIINNK